MGRWEDSPTTPSGPRKAVTWNLVGNSGGRLLWSRSQDGWGDLESRDGERLNLPDCQAHGNRQRSHLEGGHRKPAAALQGASLPSPVRPPGEWGFPSTRSQGNEVEDGLSRGLDEEPYKGGAGSPRSRRVGRTEAEGRRFRRGTRSSPKRGCREEGEEREEVVELYGRKEEKEEEEEEKRQKRKGQEGGGENRRRATSWPSRDKDFVGPLPGDCLGPEGESPTKGDAKGKELREQQEVKKGREHLRGRDFRQRRKRRGQGCGDFGGGLHGGHQATDGGRALPWIAGSRGYPDDAEKPSDQQRRAWGGRSIGASSPALLQVPFEQTSPRCTRAGAAQLGDSNRRVAQRKGGAMLRYPLSEDESPRSNRSRHSMDGGSTHGAGGERASPPGREERNEERPKGEPGRRKGPLVNSRRRKARSGQRKQQGRKEGFQGRRKRRQEQRQRGQEGLRMRSAPDEAAGVEEKLQEKGGFSDSLKAKSAGGSGKAKPLELAGGPSKPSFPPSVPGQDLGFFPIGDRPAFEGHGHLSGAAQRLDSTPTRESHGPRKSHVADLVGKRMVELGPRILQWLLEVVPLRSKSTGRSSTSVFPLPTSSTLLRSVCPALSEDEMSWLVCVCVSLNSVWGEEVHYDGPLSDVTCECIKLLGEDVSRLGSLFGVVEDFEWDSFFSTRGIDYKGDEIKTAQQFTWGNISPALPREIGVVPLSEVCTLGARHYVDNFDLYVRPREEWCLKRAPRVMVPDSQWAEVCNGLLTCGICTLIAKDDVFHVGDSPLLNGLFGVAKDEWSNGVEVYRLIMNLIPLNQICYPLQGDVETLPMWSMMNPFLLQPSEQLLISSEDVRCFFYTISVPPAWWKYLAFNKLVPDECLPGHLKGQEVYLTSQVLPMGFLNSVSLAQHVHRNLALWSDEAQNQVNLPEGEIRRDRPLTVAPTSWRIYLDNYDLLEKVEALGVDGLKGTLAPGILSLRQQYEQWEIPRNVKKSVSRQPLAEMQGAQVDGELGIAYPREVKLLKYVSAALALLSSPYVSQRQMQVVCGGLVYVSMFRRQLLGCLNSVWTFIESFNQTRARLRTLPDVCKEEILRFIGMLPLARLDFRLQYHGMVTASDASNQGGGICASHALSKHGSLVCQGKLRGQLPELRTEHRVLTIGLFDGLGALRVAVDLLGLSVLGHISVERDAKARRVVEAHFPEVTIVDDVAKVDADMVHQWARQFSQAALVLVGGGPPCQGVSGLNAGRKGALRDERSALFVHVKRITNLVQQAFPWAQVHSLMESVASMDEQDRKVMSQDYGDDPWFIDAGSLTWASRPRLYWVSWELQLQEGVSFLAPTQKRPRGVQLDSVQPLEEVCKEGWHKVDPSRPFPTFTTSRPRAQPGYKPAGINQCTVADARRWAADQHRFPPYQYVENIAPALIK